MNGPQAVVGLAYNVASCKPTVLGRDPEADISIPSERISRRHCQLEQTPDGMFVIMDLGSSNGTWFDKQRIHRRKIENGDEYFICNEKVKCVIR